MNNGKHYLAAVTAFVIWGFFPIPLRALAEYSAGEILYFRILFSCLILLTIIVGFRQNSFRKDRSFFRSMTKTDRKRAIFLTLSGALLLTVNWLIFIYIVNNVNIKTASFSYLICPVVTAFLGYVLIRERLTQLQWVAVALCAMSCALIGINSLRELGFSFFTAITYALYLISQRRNQGFDRLVVLCIQVLFSFLILNLFLPYLVEDTPASIHFYGMVLVIAIFFTIIPLFLNLFALNRINSATVGVLMYLNPLINYSLAFFLFNESINAIQMIGYSIIVVALILFNYPVLKRMQAMAGATK